MTDREFGGEMKIKSVNVWTWEIGGRLVYWAAPSKEQLMREGKPCPDARAVRAKMTKITPKRKSRKIYP